MQLLRFYQEASSRWYVDLPEYPGPKADLEMVAGADDLLESFAEHNASITLRIDLSGKGEHCLKLASICSGGGAWYDAVAQGHQVWLCDVMLYVFGAFPERITYTIVGDEELTGR